MQETVSKEQSGQAPAGRRSSYAIGVAAIALVVVIAAIVALQLITGNSYNNNIDRLKGMVAAANDKLEKGDTDAGATLTDQYNFYANLGAQIKNLSNIFVKLNESYPLYFFRIEEESVGTPALAEKMNELTPKLEKLTAWVNDDKAIAGDLSNLIGSQASKDLAKQYSDLIARNDKLKSDVSGLSFSGAAEEGRKALVASIDTRGKALDCLHEDASINDELSVILSDFAMPFASISSKLTDLQKRSDALAANLQGLDLTVYNPDGGKVADQAASQSARMKADIAYLSQLAPLQSSVKDFCAGLGTVPAGKLTAKIAGYMNWITQLKNMQSSMDAINADEKYAGADKLTIKDLGMTDAGKQLITYEKALKDVNTALTSSAAIENTINSIMKDTKTRMPNKVSSLFNLEQKNSAVISALSAAEVPDGMTDQIGDYISGCKERGTFLDDYMNYLISKDASDNAAKAYHSAGSGDGASQAYATYQAALKTTNDYKAKYTASHKKYLPMLDA